VIIAVCDVVAANEVTDGRTLAIVLGTVGGLLVILVIIFIACYIGQRWPWITVASRRTRILRAEMALDDNGDNSAVETGSSTLRMFHGLERIKPHRPSLERGGQLQPSAPKDSFVELTELDMQQDHPALVHYYDS